MLSSPGSYTAFGNVSISDPASHGILGGDDNIETDDVWKFNIDKGRLVSTVSGQDPTNYNFPAVFPGCLEGLCAVTDAKITKHGETTTLIGNAVVKPDFFAYHVAELHGDELSDPLLIFGGKAHNFVAASGKVYLFDLTPDIMAQGAAPFASSNSMPEGGTGRVSPLMLLEQGAEDDGDASRAVWLQTTFLVGGGESEHESFVNIALGEWTRETGLQGARRGGSALEHDTQINANGSGPQKYSFSGDIASLAGPDDSHFLGSENPNLVVGIDSTGTHNIGRDKPLNPNGTSIENQSGASYHVGIGTGLRDNTQTGGAFTGYAAGFAQQPGNGAPRTLVNTSPNGVSILLNAETNTISASLHVGDVGSGVLATLFPNPNPRYHLEFGGEGPSAFIDDGIFAAFENPGQSDIKEDVRISRGKTETTHLWWRESQRTGLYRQRRCNQR